MQMIEEKNCWKTAPILTMKICLTASELQVYCWHTHVYCCAISDLRMIRGYELLLRRMPVVKQIIAQDSLEAMEELYKNVSTFK